MTAVREPAPDTPRRGFVRLPVPAPDAVRELLRGLNREQRRAVTHDRGPALVIAGPGSGKTEVVTRRVAWLIATRRARPREILALTFTDNAAQEMQARVDLLVPYGQADAAIHTFHAFGDRLLREHAFELGLPSDVRLLGRRELLVLLRGHLFELGLQRYLPLGDPRRFLGELVDLFSRAKDEDIAPADLAAHAASLSSDGADEALLDLAGARAELALAYERYSELLARLGVIDHSDQVGLALRLLRQRPSTRRSIGERYRYILVDELQDTNRTQLELVLALASEQANVFAVGDPDQAIYAFRGARSGNVETFAAAFSEVRTIGLRRNYRSLAPLIEGAGRLLRAGGHTDWRVPQVAHRRAAGVAIGYACYATPEAESDAVAARIAERLASGSRPTDFAVLVRSNAELDSVVRSLRVRDIPVATAARARLTDLSGVRSLLAFLRVVADPDNSIELYALASGWPYSLSGSVLGSLLSGTRRRNRSLWAALQEVASDPDDRFSPPVVRQISRLVDHVSRAVDRSAELTSGALLYDYLGVSGWLKRLADARDEAAAVEAQGVARLCNLVRAQAALLDHDRLQFLVPALDVSEPDPEADPSPDGDAVHVLTVHRAKGLEFKVVFICGLVDGRFPVRARPAALALPEELTAEGRDGSEELLDEERKLFYVALTRARDEAWLTSHRSGPRGRGRRRPSVFIGEALDLDAQAFSASNTDATTDLAAVLLPPPAAAKGSTGSESLVLSYSQVDDYLTCPERYRLRYEIGLPTPAHHLLSYGTAIHASIAAFHAAQARGVTLTEEQLVSELARAWQPDGYLTREHEEARFAAGAAALTRFRTQQVATGGAPPVAVERPFIFRLGQDQIRGRIDRVDGSGADAVITDYKSSDVRDQQRADTRARDSLQLQIYALAHEADSGALPRRVQLHFIESGVIGSADPDPKRLQKARAKLGEVASAIRNRDFKPRPSTIACGYCPYRAVCSASVVRDT